MNNKEEINIYIEDRQDQLFWTSNEVDLDILDEVVIFITNDIKQKYQTDILNFRDEENQYYELEEIIEFKRPHTYITIPQRHDVKTLARNELRNNRNVYHISNEKITIDKYKSTRKIESVDYQINVIKKMNQKYLDTLKGIFDDLIVQPKKRQSLTQEVQKPIDNFQQVVSHEPESPKFGQSPKECVSPGWVQKKSLSHSDKKNDLKQLTLEDVAQHNTQHSAWIVINSKVYDVTTYLYKHPGGKDKLMEGVGQDGTPLFMKHHPWVNAHYLLERNQVGFLIHHK